MFFLVGISNKVKPAGFAHNGLCPACGHTGPLHLTHQYMTPHIFFIPTVRFNSTYLATCPACASVMELAPQKARELRSNPGAPVGPGDLHLVQNNYRR